MEFISTKGLTNENAPTGQVLVQYLEPSWGGWSVEFGIGYYDNPQHYEGQGGEGWKLWFNSNQVNVIAYAELPEVIKTPLTQISQQKFIKKFGSTHPEMGNASKL